MDTSNNSTIRTMLANGDFRSILDAVGTDQRMEIQVIHPAVDGEAGLIIWARIGSTMIMVGPSPDEVEIAVHDHDDVSDEECWQRNADRLREAADRANAASLSLRDNPQAQELLQAGMPPAFVAMLAERGEIPAQPARRDLPPVGAPVMDQGPTGFYL